MAKASGPKKEEIGVNITHWMNGDKLMIEIDLSADGVPSMSGKTLLIAKTGKAKQVAEGVFLGLNCYKYAKKRSK